MLDLLLWVFFGIGFLVMMAMIVSAFLSIREGRKGTKSWGDMEGKSSFLRR